MRSAWRGVARKAPAPKRSRSYRENPVAIISIAQQARPNVRGQTLERRAQLITVSTWVMMKLSWNRSSITPIGSSSSGSRLRPLVPLSRGRSRGDFDSRRHRLVFDFLAADLRAHPFEVALLPHVGE